MVGRLSSYLINSLSSVTVMTAQVLFLTFILLYTMFFFFVDGESILKRILNCPRSAATEDQTGACSTGSPR